MPLLPLLLLGGVAAAHHPSGVLGDYDASREASGTSWQPEAAGMEGRHFQAGAWSLMVHGFVDAVFSAQGGARGEQDFYFTNMVLGMGARALGSTRLGLRAMVALEPAMGPEGYPLLLQTGETADGRTNLFDRQHPHDAFMELSATLGVPAGSGRSIFFYVGLPGEPAFGPPAFMHRPSGVDLPDAPLGHHWMDATHVTFGVATVGLVAGAVKLDASAFNGREPDHRRWGIESPRFSSFSARLTVNPSPGLSIQVSWARLQEPELLIRAWTRRAGAPPRATAARAGTRPRSGGATSAAGTSRPHASPSTAPAGPPTPGSSSRRSDWAAPTPSSAAPSRPTRTSSFRSTTPSTPGSFPSARWRSATCGTRSRPRTGCPAWAWLRGSTSFPASWSPTTGAGRGRCSYSPD